MKLKKKRGGNFFVQSWNWNGYLDKKGEAKKNGCLFLGRKGLGGSLEGILRCF